MIKTKAQKLNITSFPYVEYDGNGNQTYYEDLDGTWTKREYDSDGRIIHTEYSYGKWVKREYDGDGKVKYYEDSDGNWFDSSVLMGECIY